MEMNETRGALNRTICCEARLKEIKRLMDGGGLTAWQTSHDVIHELIAALREAWGERDAVTELFEELQRISGDSVQLQARAERAAAERDTLQAMWNTLADAAKDVLHADRLHDKVPLPVLVKLEHAVYSEHHDTIKPVIMELERLRAVREAAEDNALGNWLGWESLDEHPHPADKRQRDLREYATALNKLHAALNAAQDPAR